MDQAQLVLSTNVSDGEAELLEKLLVHEALEATEQELVSAFDENDVYVPLGFLEIELPRHHARKHRGWVV